MSDLPPGTGSKGDLRTVLDRMADGFFAVDTDWRITYVNERGREILRSAMADDTLDDVESIEGVHLWEAIPDAVDTEFYDEHHEAMATQTPASFDSYYRPLETWFNVRSFPSESGLSVYLRDITERRELEERRRESLQAIQRLYAVSSDQSRSFEEKIRPMLELSCEYLEMPNGFLTRIEGDTQYVEFSEAVHPKLRAGESRPFVEAYCKRTVENDGLLTIVNAAEEGWGEDPAYEQSGLDSYVGGRIDIGGERYGTLCFADTEPREEAFTDTQRTFVELLTRWVSYELERQRAQSQLQRERDRLNRFASVVSHDLRNPLNTAMGRLDLLEAECDSDHLPPIDRAVDRMEVLIEDILTMAREGVPVDEMTDVDLDAVAVDAWGTSETADATLRADAEGLRIRADRTRLRRLLENLFRNSAEHGSPNRVEGVDGSEGVDDADGDESTDDADGDESTDDADGVTITVGSLSDRSGFYVADDGPGIPTAERDRVFETGYTTTTEGTGFGLSIAEEIAGAHGWKISVTEGTDGGARFEITGVELA